MGELLSNEVCDIDELPDEGAAIEFRSEQTDSGTKQVCVEKMTAADTMRYQDQIRRRSGAMAVGGCTIGTGLAL